MSVWNQVLLFLLGCDMLTEVWHCEGPIGLSFSRCVLETLFSWSHLGTKEAGIILLFPVLGAGSPQPPTPMPVHLKGRCKLLTIQSLNFLLIKIWERPGMAAHTVRPLRRWRLRKIVAQGHLRQKGSWDPISTNKSWAWWWTPVIPAVQEASGAGRLWCRPAQAWTLFTEAVK
jgi:hypothetical protein